MQILKHLEKFDLYKYFRFSAITFNPKKFYG